VFRKRLTPSQLLVNAMAAADLAEVRTQLAAGADPDARDRAGVPVVAIAASRGWADGVAALVAAGADPSQQVRGPKRGDFHGPLLNLPAANGSLETARVLIEAGAALDAADKTGLTALMCAAHQGHAAIVRLLTDSGAALELRDCEGFTALMYAANAGQRGAAEALLEASADPHARANDDSTPLMFAAQHGYDEVVVLLLRAGADPAAEGAHGLSAAGFAQQNGHQRTLSLLLGGGHGDT
jgi:ankyrin repeat protein